MPKVAPTVIHKCAISPNISLRVFSDGGVSIRYHGNIEIPLTADEARHLFRTSIANILDNEEYQNARRNT
jgi:hypothetical protein